MNDEQFGTLEWSGDVWETKVTLDAFRALGGALDERDPPDPVAPVPADTGPTRRQVEAREQLMQLTEGLGGPAGKLLGSMLARFSEKMQQPQAPPVVEAEPEEGERTRLLRQGVCDLTIDMDGRRSKPEEGQRAAWAAVLARGNALWDELLAGAFAVYQRQLPIRRRWWKEIYGDYLLDRRLPQVATLEEFKRLIRPRFIRIWPSDAQSSAAITIHISSTWSDDGFGVIVRDGRVAEVGSTLDTQSGPPQPRETMEHPVFGTLRRIPDDDVWEVINQWEMPTEPGKSGFTGVHRGGPWPWNGRTRFDPLLEYANVADHRARYAHDRANADRPGSRLAWEFADGEFDLRVYTTRGQGPSDAQAATFARFQAEERRYGAELIDAIFQRYQTSYETLRRDWKDRYVEENVPALTGPEGLRTRIQLRGIHVHPEDPDGRAAIGFQFVVSYHYDGLSALWRDGKFEEWGGWKDAEFRGFR